MSDVVNEHHTQINWVPAGSTPPDSEVIDEMCRNGGAYAFKHGTLVRLPVVQKKPMMTRRMAGQLEANEEHNVKNTGIEEDEVIAGKVYSVLRTMTDTHQVKHTHWSGNIPKSMPPCNRCEGTTHWEQGCILQCPPSDESGLVEWDGTAVNKRAHSIISRAVRRRGLALPKLVWQSTSMQPTLLDALLSFSVEAMDVLSSTGITTFSTPSDVSAIRSSG